MGFSHTNGRVEMCILCSPSRIKCSLHWRSTTLKWFFGPRQTLSMVIGRNSRWSDTQPDTVLNRMAVALFGISMMGFHTESWEQIPKPFHRAAAGRAKGFIAWQWVVTGTFGLEAIREWSDGTMG